MRVFITGMGAISCVGTGVRALGAALRTGTSGIGLAGAARPDLPVHAVAGLVRTVAYDAVPRADAFLRIAISEAFSHAGLCRVPALRVFIGSAHGHLDLWQQPRLAALSASAHASTPGASPAPASASLPMQGLWQMAGDVLAAHTDDADITHVSTACTASSLAFGMALDAIGSGECAVALVAGVESLTPFLYTGFDSLRSLAYGHCRPFDRDRSGLDLGEGAAALLLESQAHIRQRSAVPLAEAAGFGFGADSVHLTAPDPAGSGASAALRCALGEAALDALPGFINTHGTGTRLNDRMECVALQRVFGASLSAIPLTATKPITGHLCGGAGAIELVNTVIGLQTGCLPPILGFQSAESDYAAMDFVYGDWREGDFRSAISMNSGFGGTNTAVVLKRVGA